MKRLVIAIVGVCFTLSMSAQPAKSRVTQTQNNAQTTTPKTSTPVPTKTTVSKATVTRSTNAPAPSVSRASIMFPTAVEVPTDVVWRRDIYRELDLSKDANAPLYYPVEPQDGRVNLFTLLFQLLNTGKIPAYTYDTSGLENFNKEKIILKCTRN